MQRISWAIVAGVILAVLLAGGSPARAQAGTEPDSPDLMAEVNRDMDVSALEAPRWSPYVAGIGIGVLSWLTFLFSDHPLGVSTAFAKTAGMVEKTVRGPKVEQKAYYREYEPTIGWEWMLVIGLFLGAFLAAWLSGTVRWEWVPPMWEAAFGGDVLPRLAVALVGGICVGFGARWGCGCTSGHGISGTLQLVVSSWLTAACFFIGGIAAAMLLYRVF